MTVTHIAWDQGGIEKAILDVFGFAPYHHTTKTMCGRRVRVASGINNESATCLACHAVVECRNAKDEELVAWIQAREAESNVTTHI